MKGCPQVLGGLLDFVSLPWVRGETMGNRFRAIFVSCIGRSVGG